MLEVPTPQKSQARGDVESCVGWDGAGEWWQQPGHQVARGYTSPSRDSSSQPRSALQGFVTGETWV